MANRFINIQIVSGIIVALAFNIVVMPRTVILGAVADMPLVVTIWIALTSTPRTAIIFGFLMGLLVGFARPAELGWSSVLLALVAYGIAALKDRLVMESMWLRIAGLFAAALIYRLLYFALARYGLLETNSAFVMITTLLSAVYTTVLGIIVFGFIKHRRMIRDLFQ